MRISVFLADDHAVVRDGLRSLLEAQPDMRVVGDAGTGRETVSQVARLRPDIVLMDIAMPEMNGIEATQNITKTSPSTQVIILSMYSTAEHVFRALQAGARGFLLKESAGTEVVNAIRAVHANHRYLSPKISDQVFNSYAQKRQTTDSESRLEDLSSREREVFQLVVEGNSSAEIANMLSISIKTVDTYRSRLKQKLGIRDLPGLVKFAIQHGLISLE